MSVRAFNNTQPNIDKSSYIDDSAVIIGDVTIAENVSIWPTVVIRGDVSSIHIGANTNIQDGSVLHVSHAEHYGAKEAPLHIGQNVTVGHRAVVHACTVGNFCLIGIGAIILDNAVLEDYVLLGAGSLVPTGKVLKSGFLYLGTPARKVRELSAEERTFLESSAQHYVQLKNDYLTDESCDLSL